MSASRYETRYWKSTRKPSRRADCKRTQADFASVGAWYTSGGLVLGFPRQLFGPWRLAARNPKIHTPTMSLRNAALFALVGTGLLTFVLLAGLIGNGAGVLNGAVSAVS